MEIPKAKLKSILLYFCNNTSERFLGKVKLMKLFYFLDFTHVKNYGTPVTKDTYVNLEHGPVPSTIKNLVDNAESNPDYSSLADTIDIEKKDNQKIHRIRCTKNFTEKNRGYFSKSEMKVLRKVCERFGDKNTKYIEEISHKEHPWKETEEWEEIPYYLAAKDEDCKVSKEEIKLSVDL